MLYPRKLSFRIVKKLIEYDVCRTIYYDLSPRWSQPWTMLISPSWNNSRRTSGKKDDPAELIDPSRLDRQSSNPSGHLFQRYGYPSSPSSPTYLAVCMSNSILWANTEGVRERKSVPFIWERIQHYIDFVRESCLMKQISQERKSSSTVIFVIARSSHLSLKQQKLPFIKLKLYLIEHNFRFPHHWSEFSLLAFCEICLIF